MDAPSMNVNEIDSVRDEVQVFTLYTSRLLQLSSKSLRMSTKISRLIRGLRLKYLVCNIHFGKLTIEWSRVFEEAGSEMEGEVTLLTFLPFSRLFQGSI